MADEVLLRFLSKGLINVQGDDAKFEKLKVTANDLVANLKKTPRKTVPFALVAFDPEAPHNDPVVQEVIEVLRNRWPTYVNTFSGTPVAVVRAILLETLVQSAREDQAVAVAFASSARNVLPLMEVGDEQAIWIDVVTEIERQVDARAEAEWAAPSSIAVPALKIPAPQPIKLKAAPTKLNREDLTTRIRSAAGPFGGDQNPYWPSNNPQQWGSEFASRLAKTMAEAIEAADGALGEIDLSSFFKQVTTAVSTHVQDTLAAVSGATAGLQRRTNLLWWKEALFSLSLQLSYRDLPGPVAATVMAFDLYQQLPIYSPASISAFLHEAVLRLPTIDRNQQRLMNDLIKEVRSDTRLSPLREAAALLVPAPGGRGPLLALIAHASRATEDKQVFRDLVGVPAATAITLPTWAVWVFRELQAARATSDSSRPKVQARKGTAE